MEMTGNYDPISAKRFVGFITTSGARIMRDKEKSRKELA